MRDVEVAAVLKDTSWRRLAAILQGIVDGHGRASEVQVIHSLGGIVPSLAYHSSKQVHSK